MITTISLVDIQSSHIDTKNKAIEWGRLEISSGEGNGNTLQCSCLENPRDGGAWWAAIYGVAQSQTRLKRLSRNLFKKIGDITGIFHARTSTIKDRNSKDLTKAEEIKKRWQDPCLRWAQDRPRDPRPRRIPCPTLPGRQPLTPPRCARGWGGRWPTVMQW